MKTPRNNSARDVTANTATVAAIREEDSVVKGIIHTEIQPWVARLMVGVFLLVLFGVPGSQLVLELVRRQLPQVLNVFAQVPTRANLRNYEDNLASSSFLRQLIQPLLQATLTGRLSFGNTKVVLGRDGWLFYQPGVDYLTGQGVLDPGRLRTRLKERHDEGEAEFYPDPRPAIIEFHRYCQAAGVRLVLLPVPDKAMLQPAQLSRRARFAKPMDTPDNPDFPAFVAEMRRQGIEVFEAKPAQIARDDVRFLTEDTHWTPAWMETVARDLADYLRPQLPEVSAPALAVEELRVTRVGDLVDMLQLPSGQTLFQPQTVAIHRVVDARSKLAWQPSQTADVLVLGDSFSNIYSFDLMGWGDAAGLVEQLSFNLHRPVDRLVRNDSGAFATRQMLGEQLAKGRNRLAGKKVVVWEFAVRELMVGNWKPVAMKLGQPRPSRFIALKPGEAVTLTGVVEAAAPAPRPGTVPYKDHIVAVHLTDVEAAAPALNGGQALVYCWSMRNNVLTPAAHYRSGQRITVRLQPWADVAPKYEAINRNDLPDEALLVEEPLWGEPLAGAGGKP